MTIELRNDPGLSPPRGFSHASIAPPGSIIHLAGQLGQDADGNLAEGLAAQIDRALSNVVSALAAAGAGPEHLAKLMIYIVDWSEDRQGELVEGLIAAGQRTRLPEVPITLLGVQALFVDAAVVEIEAVAVVPPTA
ncbi:MAG: Rid family hydrolase [Actinomycetota bacterium]